MTVAKSYRESAQTFNLEGAPYERILVVEYGNNTRSSILGYYLLSILEICLLAPPILNSNEFESSDVFLFGASYDLPDLSPTGWGTYVVAVR